MEVRVSYSTTDLTALVTLEQLRNFREGRVSVQCENYHTDLTALLTLAQMRNCRVGMVSYSTTYLLAVEEFQGVQVSYSTTDLRAVEEFHGVQGFLQHY